MNQGCVAEQSTAEEMKDAWVVVAIVHLIRTEVSRQSEQTQEVIPIKLWRDQNIEILYNKEKKTKTLLRRIWVREAQEIKSKKETEKRQKQRDN